MENLSGPVGVVKQGADLAQRDGALAMLQFAAVISINLAVINSLPIPGLDGGQVSN
jgi:membrane-associated protease RseP (regulator of RpoE activity)